MTELSKWIHSKFGDAEAAIGLDEHAGIIGIYRGINQNPELRAQIHFAHTSRRK